MEPKWQRIFSVLLFQLTSVGDVRLPSKGGVLPGNFRSRDPKAVLSLRPGVPQEELGSIAHEKEA